MSAEERPMAAAGQKVEVPLLTRRALGWETTFVMVAFLTAAIASAVVILAKFLAGSGHVDVLPTIIAGKPLLNMVVGIVAYLPVAALVPLTLLLLARTGNPPTTLGLGRPVQAGDLLGGVGLAAGGLACEFLLAGVLSPLLARSHAVDSVVLGHVPHYYLIWGFSISAITAVAEEVTMNGYLLTRLEQLGWGQWPALALSLFLRTSYHLYYGLGFLLTVPFGYFVTRSFQKRRSLNRVIAAHFLFDATIFTLAILVRRASS
jgi:membrane protease YdiL (CAAX protease family)